MLCKVLLSILFFSGVVTGLEEKAQLNLNWEKIEGATAYEVELTLEEPQLEVLKFKTEKTQLSADVTPGLYKLRLRAMDQSGAPGDWSRPSKISVKTNQITKQEPLPEAQIFATDGRRQMVEFRWTPIPEAKHYYLWVKESKTGKFKKIKVTEAMAQLELPVSHDYQWKVDYVGPKNIKYQDRKGWAPFTIVGEPLDTPQLQVKVLDQRAQFDWAEVPKSQSYSLRLEHKKIRSETWSEVFKKDFTEARLYLHPDLLPKGEYRVHLQAFGEKRLPSEAAQSDFYVKPAIHEFVENRQPAQENPPKK